MICNRYAQPIHKSGRGAGGHCFIKDFAAFRKLYSESNKEDFLGIMALFGIENKNIERVSDLLSILKEIPAPQSG